MIINIIYKDLPTDIAIVDISTRHSSNVNEAAIVDQHSYISIPECVNRTRS